MANDNNDKCIRTYSLTTKHLDMIDELCKKEERTASAIIRLAVEHYYRRHDNE